MHGRDLGPSIPKTQPRARRAAELRIQGIEDPGIVAAQVISSKDVEVEFLEQVQGRQDVEVEVEGEVAAGSEGGGHRGRVQVCGVGGGEVGPEVFRLGQVERMGVLGLGEGDGAGQQEEVEGGGGVGGVGVFGYGVGVFAAGGGVVEGEGAGGARRAAEDRVRAGRAGMWVLGGGEGGERGTAGVAEGFEVPVVGCEDRGFVEEGFAGGNVGGGEEA